MKIYNYDIHLDELLDCPFCGSRPIAYLKGNAYLNAKNKKVSITIECPECKVQRTVAVLRKSLEWLENKSIELWNTRKSDS